MKKSDVLKYFGGTKAAADFLQVSPAAVSQWGELVPEGRASRIGAKTKGARKNGVVLRYDPRHYERAQHNAREY